ncbi:MAG: metallophosphoesterase [Deltaproteobacteria bacterium]
MGMLIFSLTGCTDTGNGTNTASSSFPVVVVSDVHFNPFYDPKLFPALVTAAPGQWASVFQTSEITAPSVWGADTNYPLLALALESIKQNLGASPLIIFTGDIIGHNFPKTFFELYYGNLGVPVPDDAAIEADVAAVAAMKAFADKTVAFFMGQMRSTVGDIPVLFAVGNSDSYIGALPEPSFLSNTAELYYTQFLNGIVDHQTFLNTFTTGGYYSADLPGTSLTVIGLNSVMFNYDFGDSLKSAVEAELTWLDAQLAQAQGAGKKVWLLMHIPPGADKYSTAQSVDVSGHITTATMMWNQDYQTSFLQILSRYPGLITQMLTAHTHMDEYRIVSPGIPADTTPSIAPYFGNNPAFKIFTFSQDTFKATDYSIMNYDLAASPEKFNRYYTFSIAYLMYGFLNDSLLQLYPELALENAKQQIYRGHYFSGHNYTIPVTGTFNPITDKTWPVYWCGIGHMDEQGLIDCVNAY